MSNNESRELLDILRDIRQQQQDQNQQQQQNIQLTQEQLALRQEQLQAERDIAASQIESANILSDMTSRREAQIRLLEAEVGLYADSAGEARQIMEALQSGNLALTEQNNLMANLSDEAREVLNNYQEMVQLSEAQNRYGRRQNDLLGDIAGSMGVVTLESNRFLSNIIEVGNDLRNGGGPAAAAFAENFRNIFNVTNMAYSMITKIVEATAMLVVEADRSAAGLARATGTGRELQGVMVDAQDAANLMGVNLENAGKATSALFSATTNFVNVSKSAQQSMIVTTAMLEKIGVTNEMAAESFNFLNMNLGMTATRSAQVMEEIAIMGTELGISADKMTSDFNNSLGTIAVFGPRSIQVFQGIASAAKLAGVEVSTLLSISKRFDTFQGAAEGAAKFNALLGTQLSTTEMLLMSDEQRIEALIRQTQAQGVAFDDMDKFSQQAIAAAAGIDDMAEAQRIFTMDLGKYQEYRSQMERNNEAQEKFNEAIAGTIEIQTKFKLLAREFAVMVQPVLEGIHSVLDTVIKFINSFEEETRERFMTAVGVIGTLGIGFKLLLPILAIIKGGFGAVLSVLTGAGIIGGAGATGGLIAAIGALGSALLPMAGILAGVGIAAAGVGMAFSALNKSEADVGVNVNTSALDGVEGQIAALGANTEVMAQGRSLVDNLTRLSTGASATMTAAGVASNAVNVVSTINNVFEGMQMVVVLPDGSQLDAYIQEVVSI